MCVIVGNGVCMKELGKLIVFFAAVAAVIGFCVSQLGWDTPTPAQTGGAGNTVSGHMIVEGWQQALLPGGTFMAMTDGAHLSGDVAEALPGADGEGQSQYINEDEYLENEKYLLIEYDDTTVPAHSGFVVSGVNYTREQLLDFNFLIQNMYIVDSSTKAVKSAFDSEKLLSYDMTIALNKRKPQILIYHTHASEGYIDSRKGKSEDTVVGVGEYLRELLEDKGYTVIHDTTVYDMKDGKDNRNYAYSTARPGIEKILEENPSIEVVIDLHRDSGAKRLATVDGEKVAQIMLFNGLCRDSSGEPLSNLENKNITGNLAFSLQLKITGDKLYPGLMKKVYLKNYRYNMHFREKSLLVELGTQNNTVSEAYAAMVPFADVLVEVLKQK